MLREVDVTRAIVKTATDELLENLEADVIIGGAGPSGLTCGRYLAKAGKRVVLFERKLNIGGGMPGGGMLFPRIVVQKNAADVLAEANVRLKEYDSRYYTADSVETIAKLAASAIDAGVRVYPAVYIEDLVIGEKNRIKGAVINWTAVEIAGLHVDPLAFTAPFVVDATGHDAYLARVFTRKNPEARLRTSTGGVIGEKSMCAESGEGLIVSHTSEVFPGLVLTGMAVNAVYGLPRMGAVFGGMLMSGRKAAELILKKLKPPAKTKRRKK